MGVNSKWGYNSIAIIISKNLCVCMCVFLFIFLKRGWAWLVHGRIAYECFAYLWGTAVLWEDASGIKMCNEG